MFKRKDSLFTQDLKLAFARNGVSDWTVYVDTWVVLD